MNRNAVIYARYSSDNQREESIDAQIRACTEYAEKNEYSIIKIYTDRAKSALTDKRPEFQQMINDSQEKEFEYVICHKLDRFSRDFYGSAIFKYKLKNNGVKVLSVLENLDDSPESLMLESVICGMNSYYSANLAREVKKGILENAVKCKHTGGKPPLGYNVNAITKRLEVNASEAIIVREIFELYLNGHGYLKIIEILNNKGFKTKTGHAFGKNSIHSILRNEKYSGVYVFNRCASRDYRGKRNNHADKDNDSIIRIEGGVPAIITKEQYARVQAIMQANKRAPAQYKAKQSYLLSGLIQCGCCGCSFVGNSRLTGRSKNRYTSYRCNNKDRTKQCSCKEIRKEYIENFVLSELEKQIFNDEAIPQIIQKVNEYQTQKYGKNLSEINRITKLIADIDGKISNITKAIMDGFSSDSLRGKMDELEQEKKTLKSTMKDLNVVSNEFVLTEEMLKDIINKFKEFVITKNIPECKKFIEHYVEKVVVYNEKVEVVLKITSTSFCLDSEKKAVPIYTTVIPIKKLWKLFRVQKN